MQKELEFNLVVKMIKDGNFKIERANVIYKYIHVCIILIYIIVI